MAGLDTFIALRNYAKGKISAGELEDSDKLIYDIRERSQTKGQNIIQLKFEEDDDFFKALGLDDDDIWFYRVVNSHYSDFELFDSYTAKEDFSEGYGVYDVLDEDNKEKLSQISKALVPMKVDWDDNTFREKLSNKLLDNFKSETEDIISDYHSEKNREMLITARDSMNEDIDEYLDKLGLNYNGDVISMTIADLIFLYIKNGNIHLSLKDLITRLGDKEGSSSLGGWYENQYEFHNSENFDTTGYNNYISRKLDEILEKIESLNDSGVTMSDYTKMTDRVTKKFDQSTFYHLPKDPTKQTRFKIDGFEFPSMKIVVTLSKGLKQKQIKLTEDNFNHLLYQPSLFNLEEI